MANNTTTTGKFTNAALLEQGIRDFQGSFQTIEGEVRKTIVGMNEVVRSTLAAIFARGHVLLEGAPGLGKTLLVKSLARALGLSFKRVQFTPDLMPSDVTGTQVLTEEAGGSRRFVFKQGPVFANIVLADEINRATPKTQAALLEAMEERQVTVLDQTYPLPQPFFVLATQNPIELEGTYPLPEAQLDRFLVKVLVPAPSSLELKEILARTTGTVAQQVMPVFKPDQALSEIARMQDIVRHVVISDPLQDVLVRIVAALTPVSEFATESVKQYVRFGPGPRGAQSVVLAAKVSALLDGRINISFDDIRQVLHSTLRHRLILQFQAEADGVSADDLIEEVRNAK
jgi:MoxR-like ATPase